MDATRCRCLDRAVSQLEVNLRLSDLRSRLLHTKSYGFLSETEYSEVFSESAGSDRERVQALVRILKTKEDDAFDDFCTILQITKHQMLSYKLRGEVGLDLSSESGEKGPLDIPQGIIEHFFIVKNLVINQDDILGRGSFADVLSATWDGVPCVVKTFKRSRKNQAVLNKHFNREALMWAVHLRHPNIVQCYGLFEGGEFPSVVMEKLERDLEMFLNLRKEVMYGVPIKLKRTILLDICHAMIRLHDLGVIHRDLKCSNILLSSSLVAKVSDFGTARLGYHRDGGDAYENVYTKYPGTDEINAPETSTQLYTAKVDVFSYGCVVIQMMTHEFPTCNKRLCSPPLSEYEKREHLLESINLIYYEEFPMLVKNCLQYDPDDRPTFIDIQKELSTKQGLSSNERFSLLALGLEPSSNKAHSPNRSVHKEDELQSQPWPLTLVVVLAVIVALYVYL